MQLKSGFGSVFDAIQHYRPHYIYHLDEDGAIGGEFEQVDEHKKHEVGIDLDYQISSTQTLSVTINPNYTDVEADIARQSINNPFVIFQPEKRHFFKASLEYYNTLIPTVYTRNIIQPQLSINPSFGLRMMRPVQSTNSR